MFGKKQKRIKIRERHLRYAPNELHVSKMFGKPAEVTDVITYVIRNIGNNQELTAMLLGLYKQFGLGCIFALAAGSLYDLAGGRLYINADKERTGEVTVMHMFSNN